MKLSRVLLASTLIVGTATQAGVTGVPGINNLIWTASCGLPQGSGTQSGTLGASGTNLSCGGQLQIFSSTPGAPAWIIWAPAVFPDSIFLPASACAIPFTSFSGATNQSIDLLLPFNTVGGLFTNTAGVATLNVPPLTFPIGVQGAVLSFTCGSSAFPVVVTQALALTP
jgi:hypothetical protein